MYILDILYECNISLPKLCFYINSLAAERLDHRGKSRIQDELEAIFSSQWEVAGGRETGEGQRFWLGQQDTW